MIKNYFKTAWRNMLKNKVFSIINLLGLSIGISVCFIIMLFMQDELSYDRFNVKADRIVRVLFQSNINGGKINEATVMPPTAQALKNDYPEVQEATRLHVAGRPKVTYGDKKFNDGEFGFVDANFFSVFTIHFLKGDPATALQQPNTLVITNDFAKKYFGNEDPIGKTLDFNNKSELYKVTGVIDKIPANAHFHFDMFGAMAGYSEAKSDSWMISNFFTYLVLPDGYNYKKLEAKLPNMVEKYMGPQILKAMGMSLAQFRTKGNSLGFALQPL
ncbi:ABC transporter permease, partial [Mucilaginibacter sp.]|uniref:ABC transporter permease n=1 Tax=Mucilaginibacter sp. TaxID=1882438 RepID=UPI00374DD496